MRTVTGVGVFGVRVILIAAGCEEGPKYHPKDGGVDIDAASGVGTGGKAGAAGSETGGASGNADAAMDIAPGSAGTPDSGSGGGGGGGSGGAAGSRGDVGDAGSGGAMGSDDGGGGSTTAGGRGFPCGSGRECASTFCVDGVCCESACNGACEA